MPVPHAAVPGLWGLWPLCEVASLPSASPGTAHLCRARRGLGPRRMGTGWGLWAGLGVHPISTLAYFQSLPTAG